MTTENQFRVEIRRNIKKKISKLKSDGIVGMSVVNLFLVTPTPKSNFDCTPQRYAIIFDEVAKEVAKEFLIDN